MSLAFRERRRAMIRRDHPRLRVDGGAGFLSSSEPGEAQGDDSDPRCTTGPRVRMRRTWG